MLDTSHLMVLSKTILKVDLMLTATKLQSVLLVQMETVVTLQLVAIGVMDLLKVIMKDGMHPITITEIVEDTQLGLGKL